MTRGPAKGKRKCESVAVGHLGVRRGGLHRWKWAGLRPAWSLLGKLSQEGTCEFCCAKHRLEAGSKKRDDLCSVAGFCEATAKQNGEEVSGPLMPADTRAPVARLALKLHEPPTTSFSAASRHGGSPFRSSTFSSTIRAMPPGELRSPWKNPCGILQRCLRFRRTIIPSAPIATSESVPGSGTSEMRNPILRPSCGGGGGIMDEDPAEDENRSGYSSSCKSVLACFADSVPG